MLAFYSKCFSKAQSLYSFSTEITEVTILVLFFNEFYKKYIEPQITNATYNKYWFKSVKDGIALDAIGIDDKGALAKLKLSGNLFVGSSPGNNAYSTLLTILIGVFHEYSPCEIQYKELHCNEWSFLPSLIDFPHCESETRVDNPIIFLNLLKEIKKDMSKRKSKFHSIDTINFSEFK